jgi:hypothetical protein
MKIHAHILAWNEERILPYTLDYYSKICTKIYVYDNMSTDGSDKIYKKYPKVSVIKWDSGERFNDLTHVSIKNNGYKTYSRKKNVDWVIVCDCDEILYHPNLIEKLTQYKNDGVTIPLISGHDMVSETFPEYDGKLITDKIKIGSERYEPMCKKIIFDPNIDVEYGFGAHNISSNNSVYSKEEELKLLHYKFLSKDYVEDLYVKRAKRLSDFNLKHGMGRHYFNLPFEYMDKMIAENRQII